MLGIPFYGRSGEKAFVSSELVEILDTSKPSVIWDPHPAEHYFEHQHLPQLSSHSQRLYFPTIEFLKLRLILAESYNVGVSIWEIGQGLESFLNIL